MSESSVAGGGDDASYCSSGGFGVPAIGRRRDLHGCVRLVKANPFPKVATTDDHRTATDWPVNGGISGDGLVRFDGLVTGNPTKLIEDLDTAGRVGARGIFREFSSHRRWWSGGGRLLFRR